MSGTNHRVTSIKEKIVALELAILNGQCKNFEEYREKLGERRGYARALEIMTDRTTPDDADDD